MPSIWRGLGGGVFPTPLSAPIHYHMSVWCSDYFRHTVVSLGKSHCHSMGKQQPGFPTRVRQYFMKKLDRFYTAEMGMLMSECWFFCYYLFLNIFLHHLKNIMSFFLRFWFFMIFLGLFPFWIRLLRIRQSILLYSTWGMENTPTENKDIV